MFIGNKSLNNIVRSHKEHLQIGKEKGLNNREYIGGIRMGKKY